MKSLFIAQPHLRFPQQVLEISKLQYFCSCQHRQIFAPELLTQFCEEFRRGRGDLEVGQELLEGDFVGLGVSGAFEILLKRVKVVGVVDFS